MRIFEGFDGTEAITRPVATIGSYDGVHRGHREILAHLRRTAALRGAESVVVTFHPHPRLVLGTDRSLQLLNTLPEKLALLEAAGVDNVVVVPFTEAFSRLSAERFVREYLVEKLHIDTLAVGYDHHLGHNKEGDPHALEALGRELGFRVGEMPQQRVDDHKVSSTVIRHLVADGRTAEAAHYLGAPYPLAGTLTAAGIVTGIDPVKLLPPEGRYTGKLYPAAAGSGSGLAVQIEIAPGRAVHLTPAGKGREGLISGNRTADTPPTLLPSGDVWVEFE